MVPEAGIEPAQYHYCWILSPVRLPVSPLGHRFRYYKEETKENKHKENKTPTYVDVINFGAPNVT